MALTFKQAIQEIRHELGGRTDSRLPELEIVNRAGEHLFQMRQWAFAKRGPVNLTLRANKATLDLPEDAVGEVSMQVVGSITNCAQQTTIEHIMEERAVTSGIYGVLLYATTYVDQAKDPGAEPRPTLVVFPEQTADLPVIINYRAGWAPLREAQETKVICGARGQLPEWVGGLYVEILRAFAAGYERSTAGSVSQRLAHVQSGPVYAAAVRRDIKTSRTAGLLASLPSKQQSWDNGDALPPA